MSIAGNDPGLFDGEPRFLQHFRGSGDQGQLITDELGTIDG